MRCRIFEDFLLAIFADAVKFEDMTRDAKAFFLGFFDVGILHGADVDALRFSAFRTDEVVMVMSRRKDLVDVSCRTVDLMNDAEF